MTTNAEELVWALVALAQAVDAAAGADGPFDWGAAAASCQRLGARVARLDAGGVGSLDPGAREELARTLRELGARLDGVHARVAGALADVRSRRRAVRGYRDEAAAPPRRGRLRRRA